MVKAGRSYRELARNRLEATGRALAETDWNIAKTARRLGVSRSMVYQRIARFKLRRPNIG